jgi:hypothetical protein
MNVHNLDREEMESLYSLLGKMLNEGKVEKEPLDKMIDEIMDEFNFARVHKAMVALDWKWASSKSYIPSMDDLRETAESLLRGAAESRLGDYKGEHWELGIINGTGGFQATAYCDEDKTKIIALDLSFVVTSWDTELE